MSKRRLDVGDGVGAGKMLKEDTGTYVLTILFLLKPEHSFGTKVSMMLLFLFTYILLMQSRHTISLPISLLYDFFFQGLAM